MRKLSVKEAAKKFGKEWLVPQFATASTVFTLTSIGLSDALNGPDPEKAFAPYLKIVGGAGNMWLLVVLVAFGIAIIAGLIFKLIRSNKAPPLWVHRLIATRSWSHAGVASILGSLLVPLAIWFAALVNLSSPRWNYLPFLAVAFTYVAVSFALYWLKLEETTDSFGNVYWIINAQAGQHEDVAKQLLIVHFETLHMLGNCEVTSNSNDGTSFLEVPLLYSLKSWDKEKIKQFELLFKQSGDLLKKNNFNVLYRGKSTSVEKGFKSLDKKGQKK